MKLGNITITGENWQHIVYGWILFISGGILTIGGIIVGLDVELKIKDIK